MSQKVTVAYEYTDASGKTHAPDATLDVEDAEAAHLIHYGLARKADATTTKKG